MKYWEVYSLLHEFTLRHLSAKYDPIAISFAGICPPSLEPLFENYLESLDYEGIYTPNTFPRI
jgi:hypothetical protein